MNQDNPFATGVSINQDIVQEDNCCEAVERTIDTHLQKTVQQAIDGISRITVIPYDPNTTIDPLNADLFANHPTLQADIGKCFEPTRVVFVPYSHDKRRELLAPGREEE